MDMWKPFMASTKKKEPPPDAAPGRGPRHGAPVRDRPLSGKDRAFAKGQRYTCSPAGSTSPWRGVGRSRSCWPPTSGSNAAYLLKESFSVLWEYRREGWARRFFDNWKESLKWQRLTPFEKFAYQKVKVSSSATKKIGVPPVEIDTAWANVSFAPSEAAHVCRASSDGK